MSNSPVFLTSSILNINTPSIQGLVLNKGEVVKGLVQEVKPDGLLALLIQGKLVEAFSEVPMEKGQQIQLLVDDFREGRTYLRIVTPEGMDRMMDDKLAGSLKSIGVNPEPQDMVMAKKLLQYNLPVTRDNMSELGRNLKTLGGFTPRNLEIAAAGLAGGAPGHQAALTALAQYFSTDTDLGRLLESIMQVLNDPQLTDENASLPPLVNDTGRELVQPPVVTNPASNPESTSDNVPASQPDKPLTRASAMNIQPAAAEENPGMQPAAVEPTSGNQGPGVQSSPPPASSSASGTGDEAIKRQAASLLKELLQVLVIDSREPGADTARKIQIRPQETRDLVKSLAAFQDVLKPGDGGTGPIHELLGHLERMEKEIGGQQTANYLAKNPVIQEQQGSVYYLSFPVQMGNEYRQMELRVQGDASRQSLTNADHLNLVVALNTLNMGRVLFHVDWSQSRTIGIRGVVENGRVCRHLVDNLETLIGTLRSKGYSVENHGIRVCAAGEEKLLKWELKQDTEDRRVWSVDITV